MELRKLRLDNLRLQIFVRLLNSLLQRGLESLVVQAANYVQEAAYEQLIESPRREECLEAWRQVGQKVTRDVRLCSLMEQPQAL